MIYRCASVRLHIALLVDIMLRLRPGYIARRLPEIIEHGREVSQGSLRRAERGYSRLLHSLVSKYELALRSFEGAIRVKSMRSRADVVEAKNIIFVFERMSDMSDVCRRSISPLRWRWRRERSFLSEMRQVRVFVTQRVEM